MGGIMSHQEFLANYVYIASGHPEDPVWVICENCGPIAKLDFTEANDAKIFHENQHGIFLHEDGYLYYDHEENQYAY